MSALQRPVANPAGYVPSTAMAFGGEAEPAVAVTPRTPLPVSDACFTAAQALPPGETAPPGRALLAVCTAAGTVVLHLSGGGTLAVPLAEGLSILPFAVTRVAPAGTSAVASYRNLF